MLAKKFIKSSQLANSMKNPYKYRVLILSFSFLLLGFSPTPKQSPVTFKQEKVIIKTVGGTHYFDAEIAKTKEQLETGLMYRPSLKENKAMLFIFSGNEKVNMWMKNTLIPLDMLFIDKLGEVVYIAKNTKPNSLDIITAGNKPISAVLELKGGVSDAHNINIGAKVIYKVIEK